MEFTDMKKHHAGMITDYLSKMLSSVAEEWQMKLDREQGLNDMKAIIRVLEMLE